MKTCTKCLIEKPLSEFYAPKGRKRADGRPYYLPSCKECFAAYYRDNAERQKASSRANHIKKRYGLTVEEYDAILAKGCGICGEGATTRLVLDHCHTTDKVREALCNTCNVGLGSFRDDTSRLQAAVAYLERHATA